MPNNDNVFKDYSEYVDQSIALTIRGNELTSLCSRQKPLCWCCLQLNVRSLLKSWTSIFQYLGRFQLLHKKKPS